MATRRINSVEKGGALLAALAAADGKPMMLRDLALVIGVAPGIVHSYLASFREFGLVEQDEPSGLYRLGPFAMTLGLAYLRGQDPLDLVYAALPGLHEAFGVDLMTTMTIWSAEGPVVIRTLEPLTHVHANARPGARMALTRTGTGQLFAAYLPWSLVEPLLMDELSAAGLAKPAMRARLSELSQRLAAVRAAGYSRSLRQNNPNVDAISAPVLDRDGRIRAAITLIGQVEALDSGPNSPQVAALLDAVDALSRRLGHVAATRAPSPDRTAAAP